MKAVCIEEPGKIYLKEVEKPVWKKGMALIQVKSVSICGSDVNAYRYAHPNCHYPLIIGHETAGIIEEIEENEFGLKKGDRVILDPYLYCGHCHPCSKGKTNCCEHLEVLGCQTDGSMCEYFLHPIHLLLKVPDNLEWHQIPLAEPLTIALHSIHTVAPQKGEYVTIVGSGAIGLMAGMAARIYGAVPIMVDIMDGRLETARKHGIEYVVNSMTEDSVERIREITGGKMSDTVIEASGAAPGIANALSYASYLGRVALLGWPKGEVTVPTSLITKKELTVKGSRTSAGEFPEALELISSSKIDLSGIISKVVPFEELPGALEELSSHPNDYLKIVGVR